jgi:predicted MFS family arabinose efflux permease
MKRAIPFTFNVVYFAGFAFFLPFIVLYYQQLGFSGAQISLLAGLSPLVTLFFSPFWTSLADATRRHRLIMSAGLSAAVVVLVLFPFLETFALVMLAILIFNVSAAPLTSFADSATMTMLADEKEMYGRVRVGGTIGWGVAALVAGALIKAYGLNVAFWGSGLMMFLGLIVSQGLSFGGYHETQQPGPKSGGVRELLSNRHWILFLALAFLGGIGFSSAAAFFSPYLKELGGDELHVGIALLVGTFTELLVFVFGDRLLKRIKPYRLLIVGLVATGIRSLLFAVSGAPILAILVQGLNGFTFPVMWLGGVSYADENAPPGLKSTAQGLFAAMTYGFGAAVGGLMGGFLLESIGGRALFLVYGAVLLAGVALISFIENRLSGQQAEVRSAGGG